MDEHSLRSQVGMGSESDCLFGQLDRILWTSDSEAGVKTEKSGGVAGGQGECGDDVVGLLVRERRSLDILPVKKGAKLSASEVPGEVVGSGEEDLRCRGCQKSALVASLLILGYDATASSCCFIKSKSQFKLSSTYKRQGVNSTQILGFILICFFFTTGHFHTCVGLICNKCSIFPF